MRNWNGVSFLTLPQQLPEVEMAIRCLGVVGQVKQSCGRGCIGVGYL